MLGRQHGFYDGRNVEESFLVDWALETSIDLYSTKPYMVQKQDDPDQESFNKAKVAFASFNNQIAAMLTKNGTKYIAGERLTIADFVILSHYMSYAWNEACQKPIVEAHAATVAETPIVVQYCDRVKVELGESLAYRGSYIF